MVLIKSFVLTGLVAVAAAKSAVLDLIPKNFDNVVLKSGKPTLVEFFAPWCGHCKTLAPIYEELAHAFEFAKDKVQIAKVDADNEKELGKRFGVQGFPTLKWFDGKSDKPEEYEGGRDLEALSAWITKKTGVKPKKKWSPPSSIVYLNDASFSKQVGGDKDVLVAFTAPWCGHCKTLAPIWEDVATDFSLDPEVVIAKVDCDADNSKATAQDQGITSFPTIKFYPKGQTGGEDYTGGRGENDFVKFINTKSGTHRVAGGGLDSFAGTIEALDTFVTKFTGGAKLEDVTTEIKKEAEKLKDQAQYKYAEYYVRVFDKLNKSDAFAAKELARLDGILSKGGLAPAKRDEIQSKVNILKRFAGQAAEKVEEAAEAIKDEL